MFDQKKLVLSLCVATCAISLAACGGDDSGGNSSVTGKECTSVVDCGDTSKYKCADALSNGKKVCLPKDLCSNATWDKEYETDLDCGGYCANINYGNANTCANNKNCKDASDCTSGVCESGKCTVKSCNSHEECSTNGLGLCQDHVCITCTDGVKNNDESDVDCGGWCGATCANKQKCNNASDCMTNKCESGVCAGEVPQCDPSKLIVNEILHATGSSPAFLLNNNGTACDFIEVASIATEAMTLEGCSLTWLRTDDEKGTNEVVSLSGIIQPKHTLVINSCDNLVLPNDATSVKAKLGLSGKNYDITISDGTTDNTVSIEAINNNKTSFNRANDYDSTASFLKTTDISEALTYATPGYCVNGGTYSTGCQPACSNNAKDSFEADKDCGGACGATCTIGSICSAPTDCATNNCEEGFCAVKRCSIPDDCGSGETSTCQYDPESPDSGICISCEDNIANFNESDKDCGGWCGANCAPGAHCNSNDDCITGECSSDEVCVGEPPALATLNDLVINEVLVTADTNKKFNYLNEEKQCEFIEIVNISDKLLDLKSITVHGDNITDSKSDVLSVKLNGMLPSKHAIVLHNIDNCPLSLGIGAHDINMKKDVLKNECAFSIYLTADENKGTSFDVSLDLAKAKGHSATLQTQLNETSNIVDHSTLSSELASPGMCANGGLFINNCVTSCENGVKDDDEMGIDCGGACSKGCENNTPCQKAEDCLSGYCSPENVCAIKRCEDDNECGIGGKCNDSGICETCNDGILNGYETDTDCGGKCAVKCDIGDGCNGDSDCESATCDPGTNKCIVSDCEDPVEGDIVINEVLNHAKGDSMSLTDNEKQVEFVELYNTTNKKLSLNNIYVHINHIKDGSYDKKIDIPLSSCLEPNKYLLIYSASNTINGLQSSAVPFQTSQLAASSAITNGRSIDLTLTKGSTILHKAHIIGSGSTAGTGISAALSNSPAKNDDGYDILVDHDTINNDYKHTPGADNYTAKPTE